VPVGSIGIAAIRSSHDAGPDQELVPWIWKAREVERRSRRDSQTREWLSMAGRTSLPKKSRKVAKADGSSTWP